MTGRKRIAIVTSVLAGVGLLAGCTGNGSFKGSGKFEGAEGGTAQVQFKVICNVKTQKVTGSLAYGDSNAGVLLIGQPEGTFDEPGLRVATAHAHHPVVSHGLSSENDCTDNPEGGNYYGTYLSLVTKTTGEFAFGLEYDTDCSAGFRAYMEMEGGPYNGYEDDGCLTGGHITPLTTSH